MINEIKSVIDINAPLISNLANVSAILNKLDNINWCGFYIVKEDKLYVGPFQGDLACMIIPKGRGVCGTSFLKKESIIVPDVTKFDGHIACSALSKSEIVVPIIKNNEVKAVIDIDSPILNRFNENDKIELEEIAKLLSILF